MRGAGTGNGPTMVAIQDSHRCPEMRQVEDPTKRESTLTDYTKSRANIPNCDDDGIQSQSKHRRPVRLGSAACIRRRRTTSSFSNQSSGKSKNTCPWEDDDPIDFIVRRYRRVEFIDVDDADDDSESGMSNYLSRGMKNHLHDSGSAMKSLSSIHSFFKRRPSVSESDTSTNLSSTNFSNSISQSSPACVLDLLLLTPTQTPQKKNKKKIINLDESFTTPSSSRGKKSPKRNVAKINLEDYFTREKRKRQFSLSKTSTSKAEIAPRVPLTPYIPADSSVQSTPRASKVKEIDLDDLAAPSLLLTPSTHGSSRGSLRSFSSSDGGNEILKAMHRRLQSCFDDDNDDTESHADDIDMRDVNTLMTMQAELRSSRNLMRTKSAQYEVPSPPRETKSTRTEKKSLNGLEDLPAPSLLLTPSTQGSSRGSLRSFSSSDGGNEILKAMHRRLQSCFDDDDDDTESHADEIYIRDVNTLMTMQAELRSSTRNLMRTKSAQYELPSPPRETRRTRTEPTSLNVLEEMRKASDCLRFPPVLGLSNSQRSSPMSFGSDIYEGFGLSPNSSLKRPPLCDDAPAIKPTLSPTMRSNKGVHATVSSPKFRELETLECSVKGPPLRCEKAPVIKPASSIMVRNETKVARQQTISPKPRVLETCEWRRSSARFLSCQIRERRQAMMEESFVKTKSLNCIVHFDGGDEEEESFHCERVEL